MAKGTLTIRLVGDDSSLKKALGSAEAGIGKMGAVAMGIGAAALGALAGGVVYSIKAFADFDQAMTKSVAIMGDVSQEMRGKMSDAARETTTFSATEAAESYLYLASAGLDAAQSIEALPKVAAFAQAGAFDMARATDLLTDAQSALGLAVDDATQNLENMARVGDVLVKANTLANASVEQFSESLTEKAGAALRNLNKEVEEGVAVLAVFADQGVKGSAAGTLLSSTLEGLTRTARTNAKAYEELGVAVFDSSGEMRNMGDIVGDLERALDGMSVEQRNATLASLGLTRTALDGIVALLGNADAIREYERELRNAAGTVDEVAANQLQTFWAQLGLLRDQVIDLAIQFGEKLVPHIMAFVEAISANMPMVEQILGQLWGAFGVLFTGVQDGSAAATDSWVRDLGRQRTASDTTIRKIGEQQGAHDSWRSRFISNTGEATRSHDSWTSRFSGQIDEQRRKLEQQQGAHDSWKSRVVTNNAEAGDSTQTLAARMTEYLTKVSDWIDTKLIPAFEKISAWWAQNGPTVVSAVETTANAIVTVLGAIGTAAGALRGAWDAAFGNMVAAVGRVIDHMARLIGIVERVASAIRNLPGIPSGGVAGARADGGPVKAGSTYLVGERGPELWTAHADGMIIPNHQVQVHGGRRTGGQGGEQRQVTNNITLNVPAGDLASILQATKLGLRLAA
jgi:TP901 family phage tail tape measure protein